MSVYPQGPEEDVGSLGFHGAGVTGSCELTNVCAWTWTRALWKSNHYPEATGPCVHPFLAVWGRVSPRVTLGLTGMAHLSLLSSTSTSMDHKVCFSLFSFCFVFPFVLKFKLGFLCLQSKRCIDWALSTAFKSPIFCYRNGSQRRIISALYFTWQHNLRAI